MKRRIFTTLLLWLFASVGAFAHIDIVYPKTKNVTVSSSSIFFIGNTTKGANLKINKTPVKLWDNNFFVQVIPLDYGKNTIKITSTKNDRKEEKVYVVNRQKIKEGIVESIPFVPRRNDYELYTKTINHKSTVREIPSEKIGRIIDLPENVSLYLAGSQGDYYKIEEKGETQYWIHKSNVQPPKNVSNRISAELRKINNSEDEKYNYFKFTLSYPVLYSLKQIDNSIELTLYGVKNTDESGNISPNYVVQLTPSSTLSGYEGYYEGSVFVLKMAKAPEIKDNEHPLNGITIFIDPGHGGSEKGAIGPTGICEKDVNLSISKYLVNYLKEEGANVITSRTTDKNVELYNRVKMAKNNNAFISVSIHNNALSDGKDPYKKHGSEVHYYNDNAKLLAQTIQDGLVQDLYFKNNGIHKSSFALNRETNPVSVLVECAYMIHPEEYMRLRNSVVQKQIAKSIKNSLEKYVMMIQK